MDLYIFAGIGLFGFFYVLISFLLGEIGHGGDAGGVDHDVGAGEVHVELSHELDGGEAHVEHDHSGHAGDTEAPGPFSTRVISVFLTAFGLVAAGARLNGVGPVQSAGLGLAAGYGLGWCTWRFMRLVWAQGGSSHIRSRDIEGRAGEVTVAIPASGLGQVACIINETRSHQIARSADGAEIPLGSRVRILSVTPEGVVVEPAPAEDRPVPDELRRRMNHA